MEIIKSIYNTFLEKNNKCEKKYINTINRILAQISNGLNNTIYLNPFLNKRELYALCTRVYLSLQIINKENNFQHIFYLIVASIFKNKNLNLNEEDKKTKIELKISIKYLKTENTPQYTLYLNKKITDKNNGTNYLFIEIDKKDFQIAQFALSANIDKESEKENT